MLGRKTVKRPKVGDLVVTRVGDSKVLEVHGSTGIALTVSTPVHGIERIERAEDGWWTVTEPIAWGAWNQGYFPSVRKAVQFIAEWLDHPDNPYRRPAADNGRLWVIRHDTRKGWRVVNCGPRAPQLFEMEGGFHGPFTANNITAKRKEYRA